MPGAKVPGIFTFARHRQGIDMSSAVSPLAPKDVPHLPPVDGVRMATAEAGIRYKNRKDVLLVVMDKGTIAAAGPIAALKQPRGRVYELRVKTATGELEPFLARLRAAGLDCHATDEDVMRVFVPGEGGARDIFALAAADHVQVRHLRPSVPTLEDVFAKAVGEE